MAEAGGRPHRVVIVGGGFGGLPAARGLKNSPVEVTLIDRRNFHLFQPLLYQVATGGLSPANIAAPLRSVLRRHRNARVLLAEVTGFDLKDRRVLLKDGEAVPFDSLVLATGATHHYFGHADWEAHAPGLKTVEDATEIRRRVLSAFERAEREPDPAARRRQLTFVVVGGGPTGVEMAGAVSELARITMWRDFRHIDPKTARIVIIEGQTRVLPTFHEKLSARAADALKGMGVELFLDCHVNDVKADHVMFQEDGGKSPPTRIDTDTVIWAAGVKASPLGKALADAAAAAGGKIETDRGGRVPVNPDCSVPGFPDVFVAGDLASHKGPDGKPLPGLAPVAQQQGDYLAVVLDARARGKAPPAAFKYFDKGTMATIGRAKAVVEAGKIRFSGYFAWLAWLFIHILYLARFENRVLVLWQWFFNYVTRNRSARLITGEHALASNLIPIGTATPGVAPGGADSPRRSVAPPADGKPAAPAEMIKGPVPG